jgi:hypothetical protein
LKGRKLKKTSEIYGVPFCWPKWARLVNQPQTQAELEKLRASVQRGRPYGEDAWAAEEHIPSARPA